MPIRLTELVIGLKGAGETASGIAWCLYQARIRKIFLMEIPEPLAVRREVCFSEAVRNGEKTVEGVQAVRVEEREGIRNAWKKGRLAVVVDPEWAMIEEIGPDVLVDATAAKPNPGTARDDAPLTIGLGPGFTAGRDVNMVIETSRGHHLGRILLEGSAEANVGERGPFGETTGERVFRAPASGRFTTLAAIGDNVLKGDLLGVVGEHEVRAGTGGVIRGLLASGCRVTEGRELGDIDPRGEVSYCTTISEKSRAIGGAVLTAILRVFNK